MRLICVLAIGCVSLAAQSRELIGDWVLTTTSFGEPTVTRLKLEATAHGVSGTIWGNVKLDGNVKASTVEFQCSYDEDKQTKTCGNLTAMLTADGLHGSGTLFDEAVEFVAHRESTGHPAPQTREFTPTHYYRQFSGLTEPVLHINPGDTVKTKSVDAGGVDEKGEHKSQGGNPLTGPFYVEEALPGDTIAVTLNRVRLNRDSAGIYNDTVVGSTVSPYYFRDQKRVKDFDSSWKLDAATG